MEYSASVSVIVPVYNCRRYFAEAIQSIMAQTLSPNEIIIVDDGSTDGTSDVAKQYSSAVHYVYQSNAGTGAARNKGIELARGDFISFLDADDYWMEEKLALQAAAFSSNPGLDAVFGHVRQFHSPELDETEKSTTHCPEGLMPGYLPCTMMIRRDSFFRVGWFETNWKVGQDVSWIMRAKEQGLSMFMLPDLVYMRRLHKNNKGITHRHFIKDRVRILKASLDRKRIMTSQDETISGDMTDHDNSR